MLSTALMLGACGGPSPVDMEDHPITSSTPSRAAGQELVRNTEPEEACAEQPARPDSGRTVEVAANPNADAPDVRVPTDPQRILALGVGAVDTACALGLQDRVAATSPLPAKADALFPPRLSQAPVVQPDSPEFAAQIAEANPDVVLVGADFPLSSADLREVLVDDAVPVIAYETADSDWHEAVRHAGAALGRDNATADLLDGFIGDVERGGQAIAAWDTQVSVVSVSNAEPSIADPRDLGVRVLEALGASRPPAQRTIDGESQPVPDYAPVAGDELSGDVIFVIEPEARDGEQQLRTVFDSDRWQELPAAQGRRFFVVEAITWQGRGLVAARAVLSDITAKINAYAADG